MLGPFLVDIDASERPDGHAENLEDALRVARKAMRILKETHNLAAEDARIFFSGRKGFNLEVRPSALGLSGSFDDQLRDSHGRLDQLVNALRQANSVTNIMTNGVSDQGTVVDLTYGGRRSHELKHPYVRLHASVNKWVGKDERTARMKIEVGLDDLYRVEVGDMCREAEEWASKKRSL